MAIVCPECLGKSRVYNGWTDDDSDGQRHYRRRVCLECGYRWITVEVPSDIAVQGGGKHGGRRTPNADKLRRSKED